MPYLLSTLRNPSKSSTSLPSTPSFSQPFDVLPLPRINRLRTKGTAFIFCMTGFSVGRFAAMIDAQHSMFAHVSFSSCISTATD
jgi:hypothetical protein